MDAVSASRHALSMAKRRKTYIKDWRKFRNVSQEDLGAAIGKSGPTVSLLENGKINYTQDNLEAIADHLRCEPADLLNGPPTGPEDIRDLFSRASPSAQRQILKVVKSLSAADE
jgi:transcriptional regulator with XRE-family HTH domain